MNLYEFFENISTWNDYIEAQKLLNNKEKGNTFEFLTKVYFKISPQYNFYDNVWLWDNVPEKILKEIGLPRQDLGVDLLAKYEDEYHAIQCKYHSDKHQAVTYKEVSTFLSAIAECKKITMGYICSTANVTSRNYDRVPKKLISKILSDTWENLPNSFFDNLKASLKRKPLKLQIFKPRDHQKEAIKSAVNHFKNNDRGKLIFPCGSGKSLTGFWITRKLKSKNILIAVPSLSLIKQTLDVYLGQIVARGEKVKWLCICSDDGIGKSDDVALLTEDVGVPCVTDPIYINTWLNNNKDDQKIIFTTYQSGKLIAEISKKQKLKFDLGIFDEAHKTVGSELSLFSHLLFEKNININKRVFMTATERFYSGSKDNIVSMDDLDIYGDVFCKMTFKDAIEEDLLTDYKIVTLDIKESEISDFIKRNGLISLSKKWRNKADARSLASMIALRKLMEKYPIYNAVSFHSSIDKAKRNSEIHTYISQNYQLSPITTYTVSGKQPTSVRNDIVSDFANTKKALITNARCLTEGVDVPNIDCIVFADPKRSKIDIVQALGRALRKKKDKKWGYVVLPIVYDNNNEIDNESFNDIVSIIRGLAANDERIIEYFKTKTLSSSGGNKTEGKSNVFEMISEKKLINQLEIRVWEKLSKFNWTTFEEASKFTRKLNLKTVTEWYKYAKSSKRPYNIPFHPKREYAKEFEIMGGWNYWLNSEIINNWDISENKFSYKEAKNFLKIKCKRKIQSMGDFNKWKNGKLNLNVPKFPDRMPKNPRNAYGKNWISTYDFFTKDAKKIKIGDYPHFKYEKISFEELKEICQKHKLQTRSECTKWLRANKEFFYKMGKYAPIKGGEAYKEFEGWGKFLNSKNSMVIGKSIKKMSYVKAKLFLSELKLKSKNDFYKFLKKEIHTNYNIPNELPRAPREYYLRKGKWKGWEDFINK